MVNKQEKERQKEFETRLLNRQIVKIDAASINVIHLEFANGERVSIDAENFHCGIPVIGLSDTSSWEG